MAGTEENRIFVGGLSLNTTERELEDAFRRYGKVLDSLIVTDRETGRSRGFGFVTFTDHRAMDDAIRGMHDREIDGRVVSVNKAQPKAGGDDRGGYGRSHGREHAPVGRDTYRGERPVGGSTDCFKCGRPGHFARECPSAGLGGGDRFSSHLRTGGGSGGYGDRYAPDRFDDRFDGGGRYGDRERVDPRESRFGTRDRFSNDRYPPVSDRFAGDKFLDREPALNGYGGRDRGYSRDGPRSGGGGPAARYERGSFRDRSGPYDRPPRRGGRPPSYERY